jgi:hypothetical protein
MYYTAILYAHIDPEEPAKVGEADIDSNHRVLTVRNPTLKDVYTTVFWKDEQGYTHHDRIEF